MRRKCVLLGLAVALFAVWIWMWSERVTLSEAAVAADNQYCVMEENLRLWLDDYERLHPVYHEYIYTLDDIGHDRNELAAILYALYGEDYSFARVQPELEGLFEEQYRVTETVDTRKRYVKGEEIDYHTCTVRLENRGLARAAEKVLSGDRLAVYEAYLQELEKG